MDQSLSTDDDASQLCAWCLRPAEHSFCVATATRRLCSPCLQQLLVSALAPCRIAVICGEGSAYHLVERAAEVIEALCRKSERIDGMRSGSLEIHWGPESKVKIKATEGWE